MELEGIVTDSGGVTLDVGSTLDPGTRVRVTPLTSEVPPAQTGARPTFLERYGKYIVDSDSSPGDLATQHEHYRLGTPKR